MATTSKSRRRRLTDEERDEKRARERELIKESVEQLRSSEGWQNWLASRSKFHRYSLHNQLLIAIQAEHMLEEGYIDRAPVRVAGFRKWLELGYAVRKRPDHVPSGAWAIKIWAHMDPSKKAIEDAKRNGEDKPRSFFALVNVFPDSVVDPLPDFENPVPLRPPIADLEGDSLKGAWEPLCALVRSCGGSIDLEPTMLRGDGYMRWDKTAQNGHIGVRSSLSVNGQVAVGIHEVGHYLVRADKQDGDPELDYASEELVVESIAFSVTRSLGFDSSANSIPYLTSWSQSTEIETIEATAGLINRLATKIENALPEELMA